MAVQSLYRKWRSQTFAELVGQEHVVQTLRNAIAEDRVGHAYLFTGPRGVGKTTMARLLAKAVNCLHPDPSARPCGTCEMCTAIAEGRAVDVIEMDAASHTSVEDAREIIERVQFRPSVARMKVYIIDEAHMLSTAAFNALLKTLEEPPDHALFILATTEVHKVPATILSRCQRFTFVRHSVTSMAAHVRRIAAAEGIVLVEGAPEAIARAATGSMRDALGILEQLASFVEGPITLQHVQSLLGMTAAAEVDALIEALLSADLTAALRAVNAVANQGADLRQFARDVVERLRAVMLLNATGDRTLLDLGDDEVAQLMQWAQRAEMAALVQWVKLFSGLDYQLRTTPYGHLPLEVAVVEALVAPVPVVQPVTPHPHAVRPQSRPSVPASPTTSSARPNIDQSMAFTVAPALTQPSAPVKPSRATPPPSTEPPTSSPLPATPPVAPPTTPESGVAPTADPPPPPPAVWAAVQQSRPPVDYPAARAADAELSLLERLEATWEDFKRDVRPRSPTVQALLNSARPYDVEGNTIILLVTSTFHKERLEEPKNRAIIEEVLRRRFGKTYAVRCTIEEKSTEPIDLRAKIREARKDELVRAALNIFDAHIVGIEPLEQEPE
ncbi:DNA polymerase III subunit gamma/tau [Chloroflexus aggregans]|uniref:DNA polymerase III subunit gamma/tau n=1 Tax=Chloroflexus aggregans (strain MD-66 / DSM 9485) TaxID=326427 RepID=B8G7M2_CHLAD|nr:DNA polymerase III subunit gamma/tau [Chloroflexus aggregans]ACL26057.1 DNA polymerase III, subunits gamma and tau [Chloroflexus aggregans DSM 9485]